ncbi:hypothetical protein NQ317_018721 [Molorchus minor]|uniref:Uncharacterized protein n=1 Tax=Molorchus minor TaxID=1323400 RepID=A0ABQ9JRF1_9CUCU|nr:hypothetical protein NQ317_018721 [Molorchus minor]
MIAKICPSCKQQVLERMEVYTLHYSHVPVACKSCPCGHFFYNARRIAREFAIEADYRRRTARVRREKPNYYDALEYDRHIKKMKKRIIKKDEDEDDEVTTRYTPEMQMQCQIVLEQINMKLQLVTWKPT